MTGTTLLRQLAHGLAVAVAAAAVLVPTAAASATSYGPHDPWYGYAVSLTQGRAPDPWAFRFITDTLAPGGARATQPRGYRFTTDTLAPGGGATIDAVASGTTFDWAAAGIGAGTAVGGLLVLTCAAVVLVRRRSRLAT